MVRMSVPNRSLCPTLRVENDNIWFLTGDPSQESFHDNDTVGIMQPFVMNISGVKFEEHCFYISRDILNSIFYHLSCKPRDVITYLICIIQKRQYLYNEKKIFQKGKRHCYILEKAFK